jgi:hypothetical protein
MLKPFGETASAKLGAGTTVKEMIVVLVKPPEVPLTVTVAFPVGVVLDAVSVKTLLLAALPGLNEAVTPLGKPEADKLTRPPNPPCPAMLTVLVPLAPCAIVKFAGDADKLKLPMVTTETVSVVVLLRLPEVPVTVIVNVPIVAPLLAVSVSVVEVWELVGVKEAVTPLGNPEARKLTLPLNPFHGVTITAVVPLPPCPTLTLLAEVESVKVGLVPGQLLTRLAAFTEPMPVAKSHPLLAA